MTNTNTIIADLQAEISQLRFSLADTEALEMGTAERLAKVQAENQKLREALTNAAHFAKHGGHYGRHEMVWNNLLATKPDTTALTEYVTHAVAKRLGELGSWVTNEATHREYRNSVLEEAAKVCEGRIGGAIKDNEWWAGFKSAMKQCAEVIRSKKEKP